MAIKVIKNQPIQTKFSYLYGCDEYDLMQLVQPTDLQRIQVECSPFAASLFPIAASSFYRSGLVTVFQNKLLSTGVSYASVGLPIAPNKRYEVKFTVKFNTIDNNGGYRVKLNGQWVKLPDAANGGYSILSGEIVTYLTTNSASNNLLVFFVAGNCNVEIGSIFVSELSQVELTVLDAAKNPIQYFHQNNTIYHTHSNLATILVNWPEMVNQGVCYLSLSDPMCYSVNVLLNPSFNPDLSFWTNLQSLPPEGWSVIVGSPNKAAYDGTGTLGNNALSQNLNLDGGGYYTLSFSLSDIGGFLDGVLVYFLLPDGTKFNLTAYATNGTFNFIIDLSDFPDSVVGRLVFEPISPTDLFRIFDLSLVMTVDRRNITNPFTLQDRHPLTLHMTAICDNPAFGFDFSHYAAYIRVKGRVEYQEYPDKTEVYDFSNDKTEILDSVASKYYQVTIHGNPEYIHDAIRIIRLCDYFSINGKEYIKESSYDLKATEDIVNKSATFLVKEKVGIAENYFASDYVGPKYAGR